MEPLGWLLWLFEDAGAALLLLMMLRWISTWNKPALVTFISVVLV